MFGILFGCLESIMDLWYNLWPFGKLVVMWYILPRFGILCHEISGNPGTDVTRKFPHSFYLGQSGSASCFIPYASKPSNKTWRESE
jgi:hypothetical protein